MLRSLFQFIAQARLFDAAYPLVSTLIGAAVAGALENPRTLVLAALVVALNSIAMVWNDIEDRDIDADNGRAETAQMSRQSRRQLMYIVGLVAFVCFCIAAAISLVAFALVLLSLIFIWLYNSRPLQASRRPIASLVILSGAGAFVPYLLGLSLGNIGAHAILGGIFWWIGRISLSVLKDFKDARGDARHHKKTFLLRFGASNAARLSLTTLLVGYGGFILMMQDGNQNAVTMLILLVCVCALIYIRRPLFMPHASYRTLDITFRKIARYQLLLDAGIALWLI